MVATLKNNIHSLTVHQSAYNYGQVAPTKRMNFRKSAKKLCCRFWNLKQGPFEHDPESNPACVPGGDDGNYIMFARATAGDKFIHVTRDW